MYCCEEHDGKGDLVHWAFSEWQSTMSSSSLCHAISRNIPDPLLPPLLIIHCFRQVFRATSHVGTELLYVGLNWSSCLCLSMWRGPLEYVLCGYLCDNIILILWLVHWFILLFHSLLSSICINDKVSFSQQHLLVIFHKSEWYQVSSAL